MRAQEESSVRETRHVRRSRQRRAHHQQAEKPATVVHAAFGQPQPEQTMNIKDLPEIEPFEEMEELD